MQLITAIIKPFKVDAVKEALYAADVHGLTISEVKGHGRQAGHSEVYRGAEYTIDVVPKVEIRILCDDEDVDRLCTVIIDAARTGKIGDGKIWVTDANRVIRIRTGELDSDAI